MKLNATVKLAKEVAANILYTLLDFTNMNLKEILTDMTCIQVAEKWHVPHTANMTLKSCEIYSFSI